MSFVKKYLDILCEEIYRKIEKRYYAVCHNRFSKKEGIQVFNRKLPNTVIHHTIAILSLYLSLFLISGILLCMFDDMEGLNAYQVHPKHVEFGGFIKKVREARACIDFEVP